jgi:hypothetical protein
MTPEMWSRVGALVRLGLPLAMAASATARAFGRVMDWAPGLTAPLAFTAAVSAAIWAVMRESA